MWNEESTSMALLLFEAAALPYSIKAQYRRHLGAPYSKGG